MPASGISGNYQDFEKWAATMRQNFPSHMEGFMKQGMAASVEQCILKTPPLSGGVGGQAEGLKSGTERLNDEISKVFKPIQKIPFKDVIATRNWEAIASYGFKFKNPRLEAAMNSRKIDVLENAFKVKNIYLSKVGEYIGEGDAKLHKSQRGKDGRIVNKPTVYYLKNKEEVQRYVSQSVAYIGKMVGGWYQCLAQLGAHKKNPYPHAGSGKVTVTGSGTIGVSITATNDFGDFNKMLSSNADMQAIVDGAAKHALAGIKASLGKLTGSVGGQGYSMTQSYNTGSVGTIAPQAWQQIGVDNRVMDAMRAFGQSSQAGLGMVMSGPSIAAGVSPGGHQSGTQIASGAMSRGYVGDSAMSGSPD